MSFSEWGLRCDLFHFSDKSLKGFYFIQKIFFYKEDFWVKFGIFFHIKIKKPIQNQYKKEKLMINRCK